jgi:S-DNA-T family DNA segregation ATPase FtsK/SpoIIIE
MRDLELPAVPGDDELDAVLADAVDDILSDAVAGASGSASDEVLEGTVIDASKTRPFMPLRPVVRTARVARLVVRHPHTRRVGRHTSYIVVGGLVVAKRIWKSRSTAVYNQMIAAAVATGDREGALAWEQRRSQFVRDRHDRRVERIRIRLEVVRALPRIGAGVVAVLTGTGVMLAIADKHVSAVKLPFEVTADVVKWVIVAVSVSYGPFLLAAPWLVLVVLWHVGRTNAATAGPAWLRTAADADIDVAISSAGCRCSSWCPAGWTGAGRTA